MNRKIKQGYRVISAVLIFVLCVNTLFTASISTYAAETAPGIETNAVHTYNNTSVTEGVIYETAPESGKVWGNSPLIESSQPKTMAAPMSAPSGVVKPSDKENDSSSHDGMYADTGSNHIDGVGGHYEIRNVWVPDTKEEVIPAVYETRVGYLPARTGTRYEIIPEWFEKVEIPKKTEIKRVWVPEKVTFLTKTIPAKTGTRTVVLKPGYWKYGTKTIPGYWVNGKKYIPPKTVRTRVKKAIGYRYITRTIPGKWVPTRRWVAPRQEKTKTWVAPITKQEPYIIEPAKKTTERVVLKEGFYRNVEVTIQEAQTKYIHHDEIKRPYEVQIPPERVETKVLVTPEKTVTKTLETGQYKPVKVWVADPVNTRGTSGSSEGSENSNEDNSEDESNGNNNSENSDENNGDESSNIISSKDGHIVSLEEICTGYVLSEEETYRVDDAGNKYFIGYRLSNGNVMMDESGRYPIRGTVEKHKFEHLNMEVYKNPGSKTFNINALSAREGKSQSFVRSKEEVYSTIEELSELNYKNRFNKTWAWIKVGATVALDAATIISFGSAAAGTTSVKAGLLAGSKTLVSKESMAAMGIVNGAQIGIDTLAFEEEIGLETALSFVPVVATIFALGNALDNDEPVYGAFVESNYVNVFIKSLE